uniref:Uncharacterized protein n=1 Tax=Anguilla anguilla TaxID=7936 RepID=A0A0E9PLF3_ANGAN
MLSWCCSLRLTLFSCLFKVSPDGTFSVLFFANHFKECQLDFCRAR